MSTGARDGRGTSNGPPHPATVAQPKMAPHAATVAQPKMAPHPATVQAALAGRPHPAKVAQSKARPGPWSDVVQPSKVSSEIKKTGVGQKHVQFDLTQFGGGTGGSAGDACLVTLDGACLVVDFGAGDQYLTLEGIIKHLSYTAVVTHFHDDHSPTKAQRDRAKEVFIGPSSTLAGWQAAKDAGAQIPKNDDEIWAVTAGTLSASVWFIHGYGGAHTQGENAHSAGVYGCVRRDDNVIFRWASLGDMVSEAWPNIKKVLPPGKMLNYLKLPHHGSPSNHMPELFANHVDANTAIICSGYNDISGAWRKMQQANSDLQKSQIKILTYKPKSDLGMVWEDNVYLKWHVWAAGTKG